jgi:hypothetical protein
MISLIVPQELYSKVLKKARGLARRAGALSVIEVDGLTTLKRKRWLDFGEEVDDGKGNIITGKWITEVIECRRLTLEGTLDNVRGWKLVGRVENHLKELGANICASAPGEHLHERYRTAKPSCAHCELSRSRKNTYVLRYEGEAINHSIVGEVRPGDEVQIGRNCLSDFIMGDPDALIAHAEMSDFFPPNPDSDWFGGWRQADPDTLEYLAAAVSCVEQLGFVPSQSGVGEPTRFKAFFVLGPPPAGATRRDQERLAEWKSLQPTDEHRERAKAIIEWLRTEEAQSDYLHNLRLACLLGSVDQKRAGLVASAPSAYNRHVTKEKEKEAESKGSWTPTKHFPAEEGTRVKRLTATLTQLRPYMSDYGPGMVVRFRTEHSELVWFCSGTCPWATEETNQQVVIAATIKKHEGYQGKPQTVVSRVKRL